MSSTHNNGKSSTIEVLAKMLGCNVESQATCEVIKSLIDKEVQLTNVVLAVNFELDDIR